MVVVHERSRRWVVKAQASIDPNDRAARALANAFARYRGAVADALSTAALIESLSPDAVTDLRRQGEWMAAQIKAERELETALGRVLGAAAGAAAADLGVSFTLDNPYTPQWIRYNAGRLVNLLSDSGLVALRAYLAAAIEAGIPPRRMANAIGQIAGLREDQAATLLRYQQGLAAAGRTWGEIDRLTAARAARMARQRGELIARTETTTAQAMGLEHSWRVAQDEGILGPYAVKEWTAAMESARTSDICRELDGQLVPLGGHFYSGVLSARVYAPSAHPNCRSSLLIREVSKSEYDRLPRY